MKTITLSDITQEDFDAAVATVAAGIKAYNSKLDTRVGTVLRDLLVNPEAAVESVVAGQIAEARKSSSLKLLQEAQEAGEDIDQDDVNAIMSNFNITPSSGTVAHGTLKVVVSDGTVSYSVAADSVFKTPDGTEFKVDSQVVASASAVDGAGMRRTNELYSGAAGYFFLVPVTAAEPGESGNISRGTALEPDSGMSSFVMAEAYDDFHGGSDVQDVATIVKSIPSGLSIRGFVNKNAIEGMLRSKFDDGNYPIIAVSTVGYGNAAQLRDKHNVFGVGVGGRIDVYVRNFTDFYTKTATFSGTKVKDKDGVYEIDVPSGSFPGACWIKSVEDFIGMGANTETVVGSLEYEVARTPDVENSDHDFSSSDAAIEVANSVWQGFKIKLSKVPANDGQNEGGEYTTWTSSRDFKVTAYCLPQADEIQEYVDSDAIRSVSTDVVVRCPIVCNVSVNATVIYDPKKPVDETTAKTQIRSYINNIGFVGRLTRSEIVQILKNLGALSVEMQDDDMLYGVLHDAKGVKHELAGDALDVSRIADGKAMMTKDTVVFCAEERNIQINLVPRS